MITTHVLDTSQGRPAAGIEVTLTVQTATGAWQPLASGTTNHDGRLTDLLPAATALQAGVYRLHFGTEAYFQQQGVESFYPAVTILFTIRHPTAHYHVPLLLNPFGYTTYRGS